MRQRDRREVRKRDLRSKKTVVSDLVVAMKGAIPRLSTIVEDSLLHIAKMDAPKPEKPPSQETLTEVVSTLRGDVNILLEEKSTLLRKETT